MDIEVWNDEMALISIPTGESLLGVICIVQSFHGGCALFAKSLGDSTQISILLVSSLPGCCWAPQTLWNPPPGSCQGKYLDWYSATVHQEDVQLSQRGGGGSLAE